jgi:hypothetical protein
MPSSQVSLHEREINIGDRARQWKMENGKRTELVIVQEVTPPEAGVLVRKLSQLTPLS